MLSLPCADDIAINDIAAAEGGYCCISSPLSRTLLHCPVAKMCSSSCSFNFVLSNNGVFLLSGAVHSPLTTP